MRVLFLIVSSSQQPYARIQKRGQEKTWIKSFPNYNNFSYKYLISDGTAMARNSKLAELHTQPDGEVPRPAALAQIESVTEDTLIIKSSFGWESILENTLAGFNWASKSQSQFDYVIRTNVSSYWDLENTQLLLESLPVRNLYAGHALNHLGTNFIAGDGIILSKDLVELISDKIPEINANVIDDVAIGRFLAGQNVNVLHIDRPIIRTLFDCHDAAFNKRNFHQIRCKTERSLFGISFRMDSILMKSIHANFTNLRKFLKKTN
jgi:hypothetical protein